MAKMAKMSFECEITLIFTSLTGVLRLRENSNFENLLHREMNVFDDKFHDITYLRRPYNLSISLTHTQTHKYNPSTPTSTSNGTETLCTPHGANIEM